MSGERYSLADLVGKEMPAHEVRELLERVVQAIEGIEGRFDAAAIHGALEGVAEERGVGLAQVVRPLRVIVGSRAGSHGVYERMARVGREEVVGLVKGAVRALGDRALGW